MIVGDMGPSGGRRLPLAPYSVWRKRERRGRGRSCACMHCSHAYLRQGPSYTHYQIEEHMQQLVENTSGAPNSTLTICSPPLIYQHGVQNIIPPCTHVAYSALELKLNE